MVLVFFLTLNNKIERKAKLRAFITFWIVGICFFYKWMTICFLQNFIHLMSLIRNKQNKGNGNIKIKLLYLKYTSKDFYLLLTLTFF